MEYYAILKNARKKRGVDKKINPPMVKLLKKLMVFSYFLFP